MYGLLRVLSLCLIIFLTGAQDDQFAPISFEDRIQHFSGVSQSQFKGAPRATLAQQPQQFQPQQGQFPSQTQQFRPQQQSFQPPQQQNFQPQQQQNFQPQQQQNFQPQQQQNFQTTQQQNFNPQQQQNFNPQQQQNFPQQQQQNFQPQQQQNFQSQQQQFPAQQQQFQPQQQQPLSTEALQEALKQSLQKSLQQQIQSFPPGAQVPQTDLQVQTPEHIRQFQQEVGASQQPKHPFTVFGDPSEQAKTQFRKPSTAQFQQQQSNNFPQQQSNSFQQPSQNPPFTAFSQSQQVAPFGQQSPRSFQSQGQQQFAPELPRSSQQFQARPQIGAFDQIKSAINTGRRFSPQQVQFPQRQQPITQPPTTTQPPPKFMPLNAVPPGSEQIGTHKKLEETVNKQKFVNIKESKDEIMSMEKPEKETTKEVVTEKHEKKTGNLEGFIKKVVVETIAGKKTKEEEMKDQIETAAVVEELNNILELLSKPTSIRSKSNKIASIKKNKKKPETSLIRIQETLLGLSGDTREEETKSSNSSEDINELLNLLSKSSKKTKKPPKGSVSSLQEKILKLSGGGDESEELLTNKPPKEDIRDEDDDDLSAVQEALSKLLGSKPEEDSKISPEVFSVVLQLDDFLKEEEKQTSKKINEVENLVDTALGFIDGAVTRRENAERRLIDREPVFDYDDYYGELLDNLDLSPSELRDLLKS